MLMLISMPLILAFLHYTSFGQHCTFFELGADWPWKQGSGWYSSTTGWKRPGQQAHVLIYWHCVHYPLTLRALVMGGRLQPCGRAPIVVMLSASSIKIKTTSQRERNGAREGDTGRELSKRQPLRAVAHWECSGDINSQFVPAFVL